LLLQAASTIKLAKRIDNFFILNAPVGLQMYSGEACHRAMNS